ncbi:MAG: hypothetical protein QM796_06365 [Chthoniobacteraceae bacterium]
MKTRLEPRGQVRSQAGAWEREVKTAIPPTEDGVTIRPMRFLRWVVLVMALGAVLGGVLFLHADGFVGSSNQRMQRDHSFSVPASAAQLHCEGLISLTTFLDTSAVATFEIPASDLPEILAHFKWHSDPKSSDDFSEPGPEVPANFGKLRASRSGMSTDGNRVYLRTYDAKDDRVGIWIMTFWN